MNEIRIKNAKEHNLKSINVDIPLNKFVIFAGKSGSGKSSLAIDIIYEGYFNKSLGYEIPTKPCALFQRVDVLNSDKSALEYIQIDNIDNLSKNEGCKFSAGTLEKIIKLIELDKIDLNQPVKALSLGQFQKIRLLKMLLSIRDEKLLILDEPAIGLTFSEAEKLAYVCKLIVKAGFSLIVIEHLLPMIKNCDYIIEFGPGAGCFGGEVIFSGNVSNFMNSESELANIIRRSNNAINEGQSLSKKLLRIPSVEQYKFSGVEITLPIGNFTCIAGKTGTGKTACLDVLYRSCDKSAGAGERRKGLGEIAGKNQIRRPYIIDQSPIGTHPSSVPATYINIMDTIRDIFYESSKGNRLTKSDFSFNAEGKCKECSGQGIIKSKIGKHEISTKCCVCDGLRYRPDILKIEVKGLSIGNILAKTGDELLEINLGSGIVERKLKFLKSVGLGYLCIGQPSNSLSGGEAQRIKISKELSKKLGDRCVYILDTPSRGLHISNIKDVLNALKSIVKKNNTVVIAENNPYFIRECDWLVYLDIDESGKRNVFYQGRPKDAPKNILEELGV